MNNKRHAFIVSSSIKDVDELISTIKQDVLVIKYNVNSNISELQETISNIIGDNIISSIAIATHLDTTEELSIRLTTSDSISLNSLKTNYLHQKFIIYIGSKLDNDGRIDLLACNLMSTIEGENIISEISMFAGKQVAASSDLIGSESLGGSWTLNYGNIDLKKIYFDENKIDNYIGLFNPINHYYNGVNSNDGLNIIDNYSVTRGGYVYFVYKPTTFKSSDNYPLIYTAEGIPYWLTFNPEYRLFSGFAMAKIGKPALKSFYTITVYASDTAGGMDSLSFNIKMANVTDTAQQVPIFASDPVTYFNIPEGASAGTPLNPAVISPLAIDSGSGTYGVINYRITAPINADWTSNFAVGSNGTLSVAKNLDLSIGQYMMTIEAVDGTDYYNSTHLTITVTSRPKPIAWVDFSNSTFAENGKTNTINVKLETPAFEETSIYLNFLGTATKDIDYIVPSTMITIPYGSTIGNMTITSIVDTILDSNETIIVSINSGNVQLNVTAHPTNVTATIIDYPYTKIFLGHPICIPNTIVY